MRKRRSMYEETNQRDAFDLVPDAEVAAAAAAPPEDRLDEKNTRDDDCDETSDSDSDSDSDEELEPSLAKLSLSRPKRI